MLSLDKYDYDLPDTSIANTPASPRDSARLFVYDTASDTITFDTFRNIGRHLPSPSLLVFNDTKVVPARLWLTKPTGGKIQVLLLLNEPPTHDGLVKGIVDRKLETGVALSFPSGDTLSVEKHEGQYFFFRSSVPPAELHALIEKYGTTPIPPYIKGARMSEYALRERYQSMFAKHPASVAAPTASLHFTPRVIRDLEKRGISREFVTLHVGLGTFGTITEENFKTKKLFTEYYGISEHATHAISNAKKAGIPVIPVGTTACRTLESAFQGLPLDKSSGRHLNGGRSKTDLFIFPPYEFRAADALITNFHVPRSSLMLLVDAFLAHKKSKRRILDLYTIALKENFRFYSFGDGMLIK
jgi:S-adenosylmethionine:tRNA ribosyltransferase-isomerase